MKRREFLVQTVKGGSLLLLLPVGWSVAGCSSNDNDSDNIPGGPTSNTGNSLLFTSSTVQAHNHQFVIVSTDLTAPPAAGISADTSIAQSHLHTVSLSQAELQMIEAGQTITKDTTITNAHLHTFSFSLAAGTATTGGAGSTGAAGSSTGAAGTTGQAGTTGTGY